MLRTVKVAPWMPGHRSYCQRVTGESFMGSCRHTDRFRAIARTCSSRAVRGTRGSPALRPAMIYDMLPLYALPACPAALGQATSVPGGAGWKPACRHPRHRRQALNPLAG